jgi:hypothetical protein
MKASSIIICRMITHTLALHCPALKGGDLRMLIFLTPGLKAGAMKARPIIICRMITCTSALHCPALKGGDLRMLIFLTPA